jgi:GNAT superfamily N-acetyltransferase
MPPGTTSPEEFSVSLRRATPAETELLRAIDDDACALYSAYGLAIALPADHPFARDELARWQHSAELGRVWLAVDAAGRGVGFAALDRIGEVLYLDQLSVRMSAMRKGVGRRLLAESLAWARAEGGQALWLTTYAHLPFNRPYYERAGFLAVPEDECSAGILHHLVEQRRYLPMPEQRIVMRHVLGAAPESSLQELVAAFCSLTLPKEGWTHRAHLRVGAWHVHHHGAVEALVLLRDRIRKFNAHHGGQNTESAGYHETITAAYVQLIDAFLRASASRGALERRVELLLAGPLAEKSLLFRYWSGAALMSTQARLSWLPPDLAPLALPPGAAVLVGSGR